MPYLLLKDAQAEATRRLRQFGDQQLQNFQQAQAAAAASRLMDHGQGVLSASIAALASQQPQQALLQPQSDLRAQNPTESRPGGRSSSDGRSALERIDAAIIAAGGVPDPQTRNDFVEQQVQSVLDRLKGSGQGQDQRQQLMTALGPELERTIAQLDLKFG